MCSGYRIPGQNVDCGRCPGDKKEQWGGIIQDVVSRTSCSWSPVSPGRRPAHRRKQRSGVTQDILSRLLSVLAEVLKTPHERVAGQTGRLGRTLQGVLVTVYLQRALQRSHNLGAPTADHLVDSEQIPGGGLVDAVGQPFGCGLCHLGPVWGDVHLMVVRHSPRRCFL